MNTQIKKAKSEKLSKDELKELKALRKTFDSDSACAVFIGVDRMVLRGTILRGSGHPDYVAKIREALTQKDYAA